MTRLSRPTLIQLGVFATVSVTAVAFMLLGYVKLPALLFGAGRYTVNVELTRSGGLYQGGNVTYRGIEVGRVDDVQLNQHGEVIAVLSLTSGITIPSDVEAQVRSQSAIGEQFVALRPLDENSPPLRDGDVIPANRTTVPPDISGLLDATNRGLQAIPRDSLKTLIDETHTGLGGLGPELSRLVTGSTKLAIEGQRNLGAITTLIDDSAPVLDAQTDSADAIQAWATHLADVSNQLRSHDDAVANILQDGGAAAEQARLLIDRLRPTLPVLLANLVSVGQVAVVYQANVEQLLTLVPQSVAILQAIAIPNLNTLQDYNGGYLDANLNVNLPRPCTTGFLPAQQQRVPTFEDHPERVAGDLYCRVPQDSDLAVRGVRNIPCETRPGKRAPTVKMCESDEDYVPLNDGENWKGDPNATLSGQPVPQAAPVAPGTQPDQDGSPGTPPLAVTPYDPTTGSYIGPDGQVHTQANLSPRGAQGHTWQSMLLPPVAN